MSKTTYIALIVLGLLLGATIGWASITYLTIQSSGNVKTPTTLASAPSSIDWGDFTQGTPLISNRTVTLTNTGQTATLPLKLSVGWGIGTILGEITWNGTDTVINGGESKTYWIALTYTDTAYSGSFNVAIYIGA